MKSLLLAMFVALLNASNPIEEASSKGKNAETENRKKQLIETLEKSDVKLYYEKDLPRLTRISGKSKDPTSSNLCSSEV